METVGPQGEIVDHVDGRLLNPSHPIEGGWFIMQESKLRGDSKMIGKRLQMLDWMWQRG